MNQPETDAQAWRAWFATPYVQTVRPVPGSSDLHLVIENGRDHSVGRIWNATTGSLSDAIPCPVGLGAVLSPDGAWIVELADDGGSEVGHLCRRSIDGETTIDLTPERGPYVLRGLEFSADGATLAATVVDDGGHHLLVIPASPWGEARTICSSPYEAWYGHLSADATLASIDTTAHVPNVRRPAVTVVETAAGDTVAVLDDLPAGPVRAVRFSPLAGDARLLAATERSGFARPVIWDPRSGERVDIDAPELGGEVIPLDWHPGARRVLAVHVEAGRQRLLACADDATGATEIDGAMGSYVDPDVADVHPVQFGSYFSPDGAIRVVGSRWETPVHVSVHRPGASPEVLLPPAEVPPGRRLESATVVSADGTPVQLWLGRPAGEVRGTVLAVHGGPNLVTVDHFEPAVQAWLDAGFAYAALNYRGSVTFGRTFREGFWGVGGDRELEDVAAAVDWLRGEGLARHGSTFITGESYGGHLSLLALGRLPDLFTGALAHIAMADWKAAFDDMNPALQSACVGFIGGTPDEVPDILARYSAINVVDSVKGSAWLNQGSRDTRTPAAQAERYAVALRVAGGDVVIDWFDAGHGHAALTRLEHEQARMFELVERSLAGRPWADPTVSPSEY